MICFSQSDFNIMIGAALLLILGLVLQMINIQRRTKRTMRDLVLRYEIQLDRWIHRCLSLQFNCEEINND